MTSPIDDPVVLAGTAAIFRRARARRLGHEALASTPHPVPVVEAGVATHSTPGPAVSPAGGETGNRLLSAVATSAWAPGTVGPPASATGPGTHTTNRQHP